MNLRYFALATIAFLLVFNSCNQKGKSEASGKKEKKPISVDALLIESQKFAYTLEANGTVLASEFVELRPDVAGRLVLLNINEGSFVNEGTLLAKLFDDDLQAQLRKNIAALDIATKNEQRMKTLLNANGLNQQDYDQALTQLNSAKADLDYTRAQIRKTEVRAPFSGLIGLRNVSNGAYVNTTNVIATLQQVSTLKIDFVVPESNAKELKVGQMVTLTSNENPTKVTARVMAIEPQINTGSRNLKARAVVTDSKVKLNPGAFVKVQLEQGNNNAILIPTNCVIPESRNSKVAVIKNGKAQFQVVQIGYRDETNVEITDGLNVGDTIALNGILYLKPDVQVTVRSVKKSN
ncbi:MAG: efflux RND transporter periplasmic adaptor subunit [Chitinophagales bacterium]